MLGNRGEEECVRVQGGRGPGRAGGVNFNMSFQKLSFDNWQFVQLVKCQESKKIDEVHNRCLRLTLRCGLESHARIRPLKRYRNKISHTHAHTQTNTPAQTDTHTYTLLSAGEHLWYGKLAHVNLAGMDVISAWTRKCHSNDVGRWLRGG